ncbi:MAG: ATP synthase gamma chain (EC [uncultured Aureispira sp.]|uniref:ATP synthase gamma chain n=1 Tax=uncultured Aureispira sp. TaxID=1331704 RepID=A0A6S6UAP2_9BACT|nr:MAG: ATP synthase gamma chain (EC [uncultured Aureispira sp.]
MANLKEVRERIVSVKSTQQITKAMKMVAAAKLRRAQQAIVEMRPYSNKLSAMLSNILSNLEGDASTSFGVERPVKNALVVVVTSNRGLCGGFNTNVSKLGIELCEGKYEAQYKAGKLTYLFIGKKGYDYLKNRVPGAILNTEHMNIVGKTFGFEDSSKVASELMASFEEGVYDSIDIIYAQFKNAAIQNFTIEPFLPVAKLEVTEDSTDEKADFIFEPNKEELLEYLVPTILKTQLHKTILDSNASEQGARMTAMENATENAEDLLKELKINYNKARQEAITAEISEIVGGVAALEDA